MKLYELFTLPKNDIYRISGNSTAVKNSNTQSLYMAEMG